MVSAIIMELLGGGELFEFIAHSGRFSEAMTRTFFHKLIDGTIKVEKLL